jgi:hypothetical protein
MRKIFIIATLAALAVGTGAAATASAQGRSGGHGGGNGNGGGSASFASSPSGLDRADVAAGKHGAQGRAYARKHGANAQAFCPPGQAKKSGLGSRFQC